MLFICGRCEKEFEDHLKKEEVWGTGRQDVCPSCYDEWQIEELDSFDRALGIKKWKDKTRDEKTDTLMPILCTLVIMAMIGCCIWL